MKKEKEGGRGRGRGKGGREGEGEEKEGWRGKGGRERGRGREEVVAEKQHLLDVKDLFPTACVSLMLWRQVPHPPVIIDGGG